MRRQLLRPYRASVLLLAGLFCLPLQASQPQQPRLPAGDQPTVTFRAVRDLVIVNVIVRDRNGQVVRGLTADDFVLTEDNKPQSISTFDFEQLDISPAPSAAHTVTPLLGEINKAPAQPAAAPAAPLASRPAVDMRDRRLLVFFFDVSSMQPEDVARAIQSARDYVTTKLSPSDTVAVVSLGTSLAVNQDFTTDREALLAALNGLDPLLATAFAEGVTGAAEETPDTGNAFVADDSEFNIFNTDRRIDALRSLADVLAGIEQKKSVIYFSSGMTEQGLENQAALRTLTDRAVRANMSIYAADARGLQASVPGGDASQASVRGQGAFSGRTVENARSQMSASQDTLSKIAEETGGRAFFDTNDFGGVFDQVVKDTTAYYLLGYSSTNPGRDGKYRRIRVSLKQPGMKLEYRSGYYAPRDFSHSGRDDREQQLQEYLLSEMSVTDLPMHGEAGYFRLKENRYHVPLWLIVPGSYIPFSKSSNTERATLDVLGVVRDGKNMPVAWIRDTVKLSVDATEDVRRKNVQYDTSFELPPGVYKLKVVVRENQIGTVGSLDTTLLVPNLDRMDVRLSSVVLGTVRPVASKKKTASPLVRGTEEIVPSVARVVSSGQPIAVFYELYDPGKPGVPVGSTAPAPAQTGQAARGSGGKPAAADPVRVQSNLTFFRGSRPIYQTDVIAAQALTVPDRKAVGFQLMVPAGALPPGLYTCQVNVIDDQAGTFAFPRFPMYVVR
jgi:VWFA-related protein